MRTSLAAALLLCSASVAGVAIAQTDAKPVGHGVLTQAVEPMTPPPAPTPDARTLASDQDVGEARRAYRAQCSQFQTAEYCDCVTAGVAQALMPEEVRIAARTIGERINAEGDAYVGGTSDQAPAGASSQERIEYAEGFYADACVQYRR